MRSSTPPSLPPERVRARSRLSHLAEGACPGKFHARASSALCAFFPAAGSPLFPSQLPLREQNGSPHAAEFVLLIQGCRTVVSAAGIFDAYVPPEGDARVSSLSKEGLAQRTERLKKNVASQLSIRRIKESDPSFKVKDFPEKAQDIFIEAHLCLNNSDHDRLHTLVTENCFPDMVWDIKYKTVRWSFVESLEPPQVVQVRCSSLVTQSNAYGQVTVRMHTRQTVMIPGPQLKPGEEYEELQREAHKPQLA
ncbi:MRPL45 [Cervus elaphus hippelaphus]|uniref:Large ribosomal subunit protein mL45 n=1 Tax=Cervus elaphus hippelaphus TaxID=46360 RepID=A0A212DAV7_CEREH|nr:MRPL45 [Cervus elaphus hippelaphus]